MAAADNPLILVTNDDGIASAGLSAAVEAALPLGDVLVVAPDRQWSGAARSMPQGSSGRIERVAIQAGGQTILAYQVDAAPALVVLHALYELVPRTPDLLISGINFGENLGSDVTVSGTVGAALQGSICGVPALAASLETPREMHYRVSGDVDFSAAVHFTRVFARLMLKGGLSRDVDVLKIDVPMEATSATPWRVTRVSRCPYYVSSRPVRRNLGDPAIIPYDVMSHPEASEKESDIYTLAVDRFVAVAPLSIDLTSRVDLKELDSYLRGMDRTATQE